MLANSADTNLHWGRPGRLNSSAPLRCDDPLYAVQLFPLYRFYITGYVVGPYRTQILVVSNLMEDWSPDWHLPRSMSRLRFGSFNNRANPGGWKLAASPFRYLS